MNDLRAIGILGGTFDPVHYGHLRTALEVAETVGLDELRLMPCGQPPHRELPQADGEQRLAMLEQALTAGPEVLRIDRRELERPGPSYMVESLESLRSEESGCSLNLVVGWDAFLGLTGWYQWERLLELANLIVMHRPNSHAEPDAILAGLLQARELSQSAALRQSEAGAILRVDVTALDISATTIRERLRGGHSARYLLPDAVLAYIEQTGLYR